MFGFLRKKESEIEIGECPKLLVKRIPDDGFEVSFWDAHWSSPVVITRDDVVEILAVMKARSGSYKNECMELEFFYGGLMREDKELFVSIVDGHHLMLRLSAADEKRLRKFLSK